MNGQDASGTGQGYTVAPDSASALLSQTLRRLAERLATTLDMWECCIYEHLADEDRLRCVVIWSRDLTDADREWVRSLHDLHRHDRLRPVFEERRTVVLQHEDEPDDPRDRERMSYWGERSDLYSPLVVDGEVIGLLELTERRATRHFSEDEIRLVEALSDVAAIALASARSSRDEEARNRHLSALLDASRAIASTVVLDEVLQRVTDQAALALQAPSVYIYEYDAEADTIIWHAQHQDDMAYGTTDPVGTAYPLDEYPQDREAILSREIRQVTQEDASLDPALADSLTDWQEKTLVTVPLVFRDDPVGMMEIAETQFVRRFTDDELSLARALGEQAAAAIHNAQLYRRETSRNDRLVRLLEISQSVGSSLEPDAVIDFVEARLGQLFPGRETKSVISVAHGGAAAEAGAAGDGAAPHGQAEEPTQDVGEHGCRLVIPLLCKGRSTGRLEIVSPTPREFEQDEVELVQILANQVAASIENARLYERLEEQAITDGLTGLYNHRFFYDRLQSEVSRARRYGFQLSLLMLDLDDFKRFNDEFGHQAGDLVLRETGAIMRRQLRHDIDIPCRYGGEEFAIILPHTPTSGAETVGRRLTEQVEAIVSDQGPVDAAWLTGERVRRTIETSPFPGRQPEETTHITVSIGIATYPDQAQDVQSLVANADKALYVAKHKGKNRVELFG